VALGVTLGWLPAAALLSWLSAPLALFTTRIVFTAEGRPLNRALALTGQTALAFGALFALGMIAAA